jgi:hypothetical protein
MMQQKTGKEDVRRTIDQALQMKAPSEHVSDRYVSCSNGTLVAVRIEDRHQQVERTKQVIRQIIVDSLMDEEDILDLYIEFTGDSWLDLIEEKKEIIDLDQYDFDRIRRMHDEVEKYPLV